MGKRQSQLPKAKPKAATSPSLPPCTANTWGLRQLLAVLDYFRAEMGKKKTHPKSRTEVGRDEQGSHTAEVTPSQAGTSALALHVGTPSWPGRVCCQLVLSGCTELGFLLAVKAQQRRRCSEKFSWSCPQQLPSVELRQTQHFPWAGSSLLCCTDRLEKTTFSPPRF